MKIRIWLRSILTLQNFGDHVAMNVREASIRAVVSEREFFMVDAEQMQNRRVQIVAIGSSRLRFP